MASSRRLFAAFFLVAFLLGCNGSADENYASKIYHGVALLNKGDGQVFLKYATAQSDSLREEPRQVGFLLMCYYYIGRATPTLSPGLDIMVKEYGDVSVVSRFNPFIRIQIAKLWVAYRQFDRARQVIAGIPVNKAGICQVERLNVMGDISLHDLNLAAAKSNYMEALRHLRDDRISLDNVLLNSLANEIQVKLNGIP